MMDPLEVGFPEISSKISPLVLCYNKEKTRPLGAIGVGLPLDPEGRLKGVGWLTSERIFIKETLIKMNRHKKSKFENSPSLLHNNFI